MVLIGGHTLNKSMVVDSMISALIKFKLLSHHGEKECGWSFNQRFVET
jgi:hypothetical protein